MPPVVPRRVLAYARVSSLEQGTRGTSLDAQREEIEHYVRVEAFPRPLMFVESESGGGSGEARLEQVRLMADVRAGDLVLVAKQDRWSRDTRHFLTSIDAITARGARFFSIAERFDPSTPEGRFAVTVMATVSELERARIRDRTVGSRQRLRQQGLWVEGPPPFGYLRDKKTRTLVPHGQKAAIVCEVFALCVAGRSTRQIERALRSVHPEMPGIDSSALGGMLRSRHYLGEMRVVGRRGRPGVGDTTLWREGTHEPLVDRATWVAAQAALDAQRRGGAPLHDKARNADFLLRGLRAVCAHCGGGLRAHAQGPRASIRHAGHYVCRALPKGGSVCPRPIARQDRVDQEVERLVVGRLERYARELARPAAAPASPAPRPDFAAARALLVKKEERLVDAVAEGTLSKDAVAKKVAALRAQAADLERREEDERKREKPATDAERRERLLEVQALRDGWSRMGVEEKRRVLELLVREVRLARKPDSARWSRQAWTVRLMWKAGE